MSDDALSRKIAIMEQQLANARADLLTKSNILSDIQAFTDTGTILAHAGNTVTYIGGAAKTLTLPAATAGRRFEINNIDPSDSVTIARASTDTITDDATPSLTSILMLAGTSAVFTCLVTGVWTCRFLNRYSRSCRVYWTGSLGAISLTATVLSNGIPMDSESYDPFGMHSISSNHERIVMDRVGKWTVSGGLLLSASAAYSADNDIYLYAYLNNTTILGGSGEQFDGTGGAGTIQPWLEVGPHSAICATPGTDYISLRAYSDDTTNLVANAGIGVWLLAEYEGPGGP